jgi:alpha-tubulin suppressor-like RCC1 family protein
VTSAPPALLTVNPVSPGAVVAWGSSTFGQTTSPLAAQSAVSAIAAKGLHIAALKNDGTVVAWGYNNSGQVTGTPSAGPPYNTNASPVTLDGQVLTNVVAISAGLVHTVALKDDGSVVGWGADDSGQTTVPVPARSGVLGIAAGDYHTVAVKNDGSVVAWGANSVGQVTGTPTTPSIAVANPVTLKGQILTGVIAVAAGTFHTVALKQDGSVVAWGSDGFGQATVPVGARSGVKSISAGAYDSAAVKNDGTVVVWGANSVGQVTGTPSPAAIADPVNLSGQILSGISAVAAGMNHTVALRADGSVLAWGDNSFGQTKVHPAAQTGVTGIAAGFGFTVALIGAPSALHARTAGADLVLSWPTNAAGYKLQWTPGLQPPVEWTDSTDVPGIDGTQFTVTKPISDNAWFFRMHKQ